LNLHASAILEELLWPLPPSLPPAAASENKTTGFYSPPGEGRGVQRHVQKEASRSQVAGESHIVSLLLEDDNINNLGCFQSLWKTWKKSPHILKCIFLKAWGKKSPKLLKSCKC